MQTRAVAVRQKYHTSGSSASDAIDQLHVTCPSDSQDDSFVGMEGK